MIRKLSALNPLSLLLILFVIGALSFILISSLIGLIVTSTQPELELEYLHLLANSYPVSYMLYFFLPFQVGFLLVPGSLYFFFLKEKRIALDYNWKNILWSSVLFTAVFFLLPFLNEINYSIAKLFGVFEHLKSLNVENEIRIHQLIGPTASEGAYLVGVLIIALITAISEELLFRGFLMNLLIQYTKRIDLGIIISALLFALLHFNYLQLIPLFVFGLALGTMYHVSGTILPSVIFHCINNGINLYWVRNEVEVPWMDEIWWEITIPSIVLLMGLIYLKRKKIVSS